MLQIKFSLVPGDRRVRWKCPKCSTTDAFFLQQPFNCPVCKWLLPSFDILKITSARVRFFREANDF